MTDLTDFNDEREFEKYTKSPVSHPYVVYPALLKAMGNIMDKSVLDLGCGAGDFSELLAGKGAYVDGVDNSRKAIEHCVNNLGSVDKMMHFRLEDACFMMGTPNDSYDFVVANMVLINVPTEEQVGGIFQETARVLRPDGKFLFTDLHPVTKRIPETTTERQSFTQGSSYFKNGSRYVSDVLMADGSRMRFDDVHWTLEFLTGAVTDAGMCVERIIEPAPVEGAPEIFRSYSDPEYIIFQCGKVK